MSNNIFVVSDTWFNRPMNNEQEENTVQVNDNIIMNWNSFISPDDVVYVLGGFGISDLYNIVIQLNGEIHFLNNFFNENEKEFVEELKRNIECSYDDGLKNRVFFEQEQIKILNDEDSILSYLPLSEWFGKSGGTFCFHGLNNAMNLKNHDMSCSYQHWNRPINLREMKNQINSFEDNF